MALPPAARAKVVAVLPRAVGRVSVAVLTRRGSMPRVSLRWTPRSGCRGTWFELTLDELADIEAAIALARREALRELGVEPSDPGASG